jgi:hypothetical protein
MTDQQQTISDVRTVLHRFQDGYTKRDPALVSEFMTLFADDVELIGTNGIKPGVEEWYIDRAGAEKLVRGDWTSWGDVALDVEGARINALGDVAWLAAAGTVTMVISAEENYNDFLKHVAWTIENDKDMSAKEKMLYILRGGTNTLYELQRGERFVWPLRFTAVLVKSGAQWLFKQMQFSLPTMYFPDVRETKA